MTKSMRLSILVISALLMLQVIAASVIFHNSGTTSDWNGINEEHRGVVEEVTSTVYGSSSAIKCTQTYDSSYTGRYHSEVKKSKVYRRGDIGFYGFMFRLSNNWQFQEQNYNIAQFIANFGDSPCDDYIPTTMIWIRGTKLYARTNSGPVCPRDARTTTIFSDLADVTAGKWHKVVIQANWQSDNTGYFKIWFDGDKVFQQLDFPTTLQDGRDFEFRVGLYANGWYDDGHMVGTQGVRTVWFDEIGAGTTFEDADPSQW